MDTHAEGTRKTDHRSVGPAGLDLEKLDLELECRVWGNNWRIATRAICL